MIKVMINMSSLRGKAQCRTGRTLVRADHERTLILAIASLYLIFVGVTMSISSPQHQLGS